MPTPVMQNIDTVVVLMLENRSLDNLLGFRYVLGEKVTPFPPGSPTVFDGVPNCPYPGAKNFNKMNNSYVPMNGSQKSILERDPLKQPNIDPHEEFEHVRVQLYGDRYGTLPEGDYWAQTPPMSGFVADYDSDLTADQGVMGSYNAAQLPALHGLARSYAVSDRWFSSVPTQTFANRAFHICGTSLGAVDNVEISGPTNALGEPKDKTNPAPFMANTKTVFNALGDAGKSWGVYFQDDGGLAAGSPAGAPFTPWLGGQMLQAKGGTIQQVDDGSPVCFMSQLAAGTLPNVCYLEPKWGGGPIDGIDIQGTDYHPPTSVGPAEWALNALYEALTQSPQWSNMLFIITFDEHGGTYDHVPPPKTVAPDSHVGASGFTFERLGVRVPTILVSPFIQPGVVFRSPEAGKDFDHTSFIATLLKWAGVDPAKAGLGARVAQAPTFEGVVGTVARTDTPTFVVPESYK